MMLRPFEGQVSSGNQPSASGQAANQGAAPPQGAGAQSLLTADIFRQAMSQALQGAQTQRGRGPGDTTDGGTSAPPVQNFEVNLPICKMKSAILKDIFDLNSKPIYIKSRKSREAN